MKRLESLTTRRKPIPTFGLPVQEMRNKFYLSEHRSIATANQNIVELRKGWVVKNIDIWNGTSQKTLI